MTDLLAKLTALTGIGADMLWLGLVVFLRVGAALSLAPAFGEQIIPARVRLAIAFAFTGIVAPAAAESGQFAQVGLLGLGVEILIGLLLGIGLRLFILALHMAGSMAAQATSLSQMFGGAGPEPQPAIGNLLVMAGLAVAVSLGLHIRLAQFFLLSYQLLPIGQLPSPQDGTAWGLAQVTRAFSLGFAIAMPFAIASLLYNVALGAINRAMPALMVSFVGTPVLIMGGLVLMIISLPLALTLWSTAFNGFLTAPFAASP